ncbi:sensor histidine kinase [Photobacterium swingsii]|uniref:sensor histidine kinase n=1 Tax=Photobacterium swingsii TaxID=680026 RepID=UPI00352C6CBB
MKINQSLLRIVLTFIISTILILILGYSLLARNFYLWGLDNSLAMNAIHIEKLINIQGYDTVESKLDVVDTDLYPNYQSLPDVIKSNYAPEDFSIQDHYSFEVKDAWYDYPEAAYFIHPAKSANGEMYFIVNVFDDQFLVTEFERIMVESKMPSIWSVAIVTILTFMLIGFSLAQYIARPVRKLHLWAQQLTLKTLADPVPAFGFRELDDLAEKIHTNLQNIEKTLSRESQFLQHASHELRTPIAVILSNASLMEHMWHDAPPACQKPLERINRAGLTMSHLTETLLWLTRNKDYQPKIETFNLSQLTEELVEEHQYLLGGKDVTVELALSSVTQSLPKVMIRIIVANLIRNAMQHTDTGHIVIQLDDNKLTIINWGELLTGEKSDGFGLGIKLVRQVCDNQQWHYEQNVNDTSCTVEVVFDASSEPTRHS